MTLTIEELKYGAEVGDLGIEAVRAVCAEALANREAQSVLCVDLSSDFIKHIQKFSEEVAKWPEWKRQGADVTVFTAQPTVPEEMTGDGVLAMHDCGYIEGWNACRTAMLEATSRN